MIVAGLFILLKFGFTLADNGDLAFLLLPVNGIVGFLTGSSAVYLPNDNQSCIVLKKDIFRVAESEIIEKNWRSGLVMQAKWMSQVLHPETSDREWLNLVKYSFMSRIMTPVTSYLVVENEAQKAMLRKKQEQVLSGNRSLDLDESTQRMSEPELLLLGILFGLVMWLRKKRKQTL